MDSRQLPGDNREANLVEEKPTGEEPENPFAIADRLRALARTGLHFSTDPYDRARYDEILEIAADLLIASSGANGKSVSRLVEEWSLETGYVTPKVGVDGCIFDDIGRLLLIRRSDNGLWALPGGWAEVGSTGAENIAREIEEETGLIVAPVSLIGLYDSKRRGARNLHHFYQAIYLCQIRGGEARTTEEATDIRYFERSELPDLASGHRRAIADALAGWPDFAEPKFD